MVPYNSSKDNDTAFSNGTAAPVNGTGYNITSPSAISPVQYSTGTG
jgi:hypothetical protein